MPEYSTRPPGWFRTKFSDWVSTNGRLLALADQGTVSALNLITTIVIGRACDKGELGLYTVGFTIVALSFTIQRALIITPYTLSTPRLAEADHRRFKGSTMLQNIGLTFLIIVVLGISGTVAVVLENANLAGLLLTLGAVGAPILFREYARQTSIAELRFHSALLLDIGTALLQLVGIVALALRGMLDSAMAFIILGVSSGLASLFWIASNRKSVEFRAGDFRLHLAQNWFFGRWLFTSGVLAQLSVSVYPWLILTFHGAAEAGVWAACAGVVAIYNPVMLALYNESAPRIAHDFASGDIISLRRSVARTTKVCTLATLPFFVVLVAFGNELVVVMYGAKYGGAEMVVGLLAAATFVFALGFGYPPGLLALGRPGLDFSGNLMSFLVLAAVGWWFAEAYGAVGAAAGVLLARVAASTSKAWFFEYAIRRVPK